MLYLLSKQMNRVTFFTTILQTWALNVEGGWGSSVGAGRPLIGGSFIPPAACWSVRGQETEPQIIPSMSERMFE